ncbi:MAG: Fe-S cluster assembly protein SufD [Bacteroidetes bacterium]|nr:Fe-S cluster assembly protein SufD [Bacteroidota bacterium]
MKNKKKKWSDLMANDQLFKTHYTALAAGISGNSDPDAVKSLRKTAIKEFTELSFPTKKDEPWKYSKVDGLLSSLFSPAEKMSAVSDSLLTSVQFGNLETDLYVFVDGKLNPALTQKSPESSVSVITLKEAFASVPNFAETFLSKSSDKSDLFANLGSAFLQDGAFISIPDRKIQTRPVHLLFISTGNLVQPKLIISAGKSSESTFIEHFISDGNPAGFTNVSTALFLAENAVVHHTKITDESDNGFHIGRIEAFQQTNSTWKSHVITMGGGMVRNEVTARLSGEGVNCLMNGLYLVTGTHHVENITLIDHQKPNGTSQESYKGILSDKSTGVFDGKIIVQKDAQKTYANQSNRNLLLSDEATADSKPQLEIYADDVKCFHGATVGQLDEMQLFYLQSRGIGEPMAKAMLTHAFAVDVLNSIPQAEIREYLDQQILERLHSPFHFEETEV